MKNNPTKLLSSYTTTIILLLVYALLMAIATIVEKYYGTHTAKAVIYYSPLFLFLQLLLVLNFIFITIRKQLITLKKWSYLTIHLALVVILGGALTTHTLGKEGLLHIREGEQSNEIIVNEGNQRHIQYLPFEIELLDFKLTRYPGSQSPSSYESYLRLHADNTQKEVKVYMNNVLDFKGYRFYQASYDPDERGTILSVNHDEYGRAITYLGYTLLFLGLILSFFDRNSRFRKLWRQLNQQYALVMMAFVFMGSLSATAQNLIISPQHASLFGELPMQSNNGRIVPINTFASEIVRKFNVKGLIGEMTPDQLLLSIMTYPADWAIIPMIEVKDEEVAQQMGWQNKRIAYRDAFDERGNYRLSLFIEQIYSKNPSERSRHDKELLKIDDRLNILHELLNRRLVRIFPMATDTISYRWYAMGEITRSDSTSTMAMLSRNYLEAVKKASVSMQWESADAALDAIVKYQWQNEKGNHIYPAKLHAEVIYNNLDLLRYCKICYLILGGILLLFSFSSRMPRARRNWKDLLFTILLCMVVVVFVLHTVSLGMRWYISGYAPWSNSYETMVSLAWAGVLCGFIFARRNHLVVSLATLFGGIVLFVSSLSWMDPQITPLVPVLKSPWLMAHVATLVMAYGFLGISCMIGTSYLFITLSSQSKTSQLLKQLTVINEISMLVGTALLTIGIFLGAIWANESWGRYWSWDPKETWALITMVIYATLLHAKWMSKCSDRLFNLLSQTALLSILMTFLGVNYFLSGMHSYGSHDALAGIPVWVYLLFVAFFTLPGILSKCFGKRHEE